MFPAAESYQIGVCTKLTKDSILERKVTPIKGIAKALNRAKLLVMRVDQVD
jgi:hypothetical protein